MPVIQILADRHGTGKTSLAGALLVSLVESGKRAAYWKPFSGDENNDADTAFMSRYLPAGKDVPQPPNPRGLPAPPEPNGPLSAPLNTQISDEVARLQAAADVVLVEGPDLTLPDGGASSLPFALAPLLESRVILLFGYTEGLSYSAIRSVGETLGERLTGVIINAVPVHRMGEVHRSVVPELQDGGVPLLGAIPEDRSMLAVTVQQIADHLNGRWVQDPETTDAPIEHFLIGGNIMDSGPTYFGRYANQAVITRAARPDIQLASLMADTKCLVLTGGSEPIEYIKTEALQRNVALILVDGNTLETAEALGINLPNATAHSEQKIQRFLQLLREHLDWDALAAVLS